MKKISILIIFVLNSIIIEAQTFDYQRDYTNILERSKNKTDSLFYDRLVNRFISRDTTLTNFEMVALMIGFTGQKNFKPYNYLDTERDIYDLNDKGKFSDAIKMCDTFLQTHPVSQTALIEKSYAFYKLGQQDSADKYSWMFGKIMQAMDWSGDGRTPETAFFAVGPTDGQNFIRKYYRAKIGKMGSGRDKHNNFCDIQEMKYEKDGKQLSVDLYFVIEHAVNTMYEDLKIDELLRNK